ISRPIVVIVCMTWLLRIVGPYQHPHPWHSCAGGGAVHSIISGSRIGIDAADCRTLLLHNKFQDQRNRGEQFCSVNDGGEFYRLLGRNNEIAMNVVQPIRGEKG